MANKELLDILKKISTLLEKQMGTNCEIVLHDLERPYDSTIVDIRNGHITNRSVGDCGSNLGLEVIRGKTVNGDKFNYITYTTDGKILRSSSVFFQDDEGKTCACLCINQDISNTLMFEGFLHEFNKYEISKEPVKEVFARNVNELLEFFIADGQKKIGKSIAEMNREDKMAMVKYLDEKGAFQITKSSERVSEAMDISKYTLYNYLDAGRRDAKQQQESEAQNGT